MLGWVWQCVYGVIMFLVFLGIARVVWALIFDDDDMKGGGYGGGA